jgi:inorganic pyrophosphatase
MNYDPRTKKIDLSNRQQETMLPYTCNGGFIPLDDEERIPVWIIGQRLQTGQVLGIIPMALVEYTQGDQMHTDVIAVPSDTLLQSIRPNNFRDLIVTYEPVKFSFEYWLRNRFGVGSVSRIAWKDDEAAASFVVAQINGNLNDQ